MHLSEPTALDVAIIVPMYRDWESVGKLLEELGSLQGMDLRGRKLQISIVVVDDSPHFQSVAPLPVPTSLGECVTQLRLRRNVGHQRAIAIGLAHAVSLFSDSILVVMDGDGEDDPQDVPRLLAALLEQKDPTVVFAERTKRSEKVWFQVGYKFYRLVHWALTGHWIRFGNFSAIPRELALMVLSSSDLWSHYAASVVKLRLPYILVPTSRGQRYAGESTMSPINLVAHGLTAVAVFYDVATVRLTLGVCACVFGAALTRGIAVLIPLPWLSASTSVAAWMLLGSSLMMISLQMTLAMLRSKSQAEVLPMNDAASMINRP